MKTFTKIYISILLTICGLSSAFAAGNWNIYAAVIADGKTPGRGLLKIFTDAKTIKNLGFKNVTTFDADIYPNNTNNLIYTANHNGLFVTKNNGKKWRVVSDHNVTEVQKVVTANNNPAIVYAGTSYGLYKSTEYGENLKKLTNMFVSALADDIKDSNRLYIGQEDGLLITDDAGKTFNKVPKLNYYINSITQNKYSPNKIYVGSEDDGIFISKDRGKTFTQCKGIAAEDAVYSIVIDQKNPVNIYAGTHKNGILVSNDGGKSWKSYKTGLEKCYAVYSIAINPENSNILYAGTTDGIYISNDSGKSWKPFALTGAHVGQLFIVH